MKSFAAVICLAHLSYPQTQEVKGWWSYSCVSRIHLPASDISPIFQPITGKIEIMVDVIVFYRISDLVRLSTVWIVLTQHRSISSPLTISVL